VDGFAIRQQDYAQEAIIHFCDSSPAPYSPIFLYGFSFRKLDDLQNPFISDYRSA
jgi:hypothetical protein